GARVGWSDLHKVLGTWGLPVQAMLAFTGAFMCLSELFLPAFVGPGFGGDHGAAEYALEGEHEVTPARGGPAAPPPIDGLVARAEAAAGMRAEHVPLHHWGDVDSTALVYGRVPEGFFPEAAVALRARDGAVVQVERPGTLPAAHALSHALY